LKEHSFLKSWLTLPDVLPMIRQRFCRVQVEQRSWYATVRAHASRTALLFVDPPFFPGTVARYYPVEMTVNEHRAMLAVLKQVPGFVVLCGYDNVVYRRELCNWHPIKLETKGHIGLNGEKNTGYAWLNYDPATTPLWTP
jgi:DNA adenine methylase